MLRSIVRVLPVAVFVVLASGCGGGGSRSVPAPSGNPQQQPASVAGAVIDGVPASAARGIRVSVHLPLRNSSQLDTLVQSQSDKNSPEYHHFLTAEQFRASYGPTSADLTAAAASLTALGFTTHLSSQNIIADAPQTVVERGLGVRLTQSLVRGKSVLAADRAPTLPAALAKAGATISFSPLVMHVNSRRAQLAAFVPDNRYSPEGPYWFDDLKQAYGYPSYQQLNGAGRTIGIVMSSDVLDSDLALYFGHEKLAPPSVGRRPVDGGPPPFDPNNGASDEASLDVQMSFGSAPGSRILLYDIPDLSDQSILDAYAAAIDENKVDIVSSSFGLCELYYTKAYNGGTDFTFILQQYHDLFRQGNAQGITFVASSGDNGAYDCEDIAGTKFIKGVENPADDTDVTGVGGTNLITASVANSLRSTYVSENAYFDPFDPAQGALPNEIWGSGGGISVIFPKPWYQLLVNTRADTRTVPDIAMHMGGCPIGSISPCAVQRSSVITAIGGSFYLLIGTSASAPELAGLLAVQEQRLGSRLGNANGDIYLLGALGGSSVYRHPPGDNGYSTHPDYDYVLGNGTPHAADFALDPFAPLAGNPQTPSNP
jgi:subtilase family serine protease